LPSFCLLICAIEKSLMIYFKWAFLVIFNLILKYLIAWPLTPIIVLFAKKDGWLPWWLNYFNTVDSNLDGDAGWINESRPFKNNTWFYRYFNRCRWLWRNSLYGFNESVLAVRFDINKQWYSCQGSETIGNGPGGHSGTVKRRLHFSGNTIAWQWYTIRRLKHFPNKCIRINLGWKLWNYPNAGKGHLAFSCWINHFIP